MRGTTRFFLSRKVAIIFLLLTLFLLIVATRLEDVTVITTSTFFLILPLFIFISISLCTLNRLRQRRTNPPDAAAFRFKKTLTVSNGWDWAKAEDYLVRRGWRYPPPPFDDAQGRLNPLPPGEGRYMLLSKGGQGFWGSMVFHAGLLLLLVAAAVTSATLFSASLLLTEGAPRSLGRAGLLKVWREPLWPTTFSKGDIVMYGFKAVYEDDRFPVDYVAQVKIEEGLESERFADIGVNKPLKIGWLQYTISRYGFAPGFLIKGADGEVLFDGYVSLELLGEAEDYFDIPGTDLSLYIRLFPDFVRKEGQPSTRSRVLNNPVFGVKVRKIVDRNEVVSGKLAKPGETVEMRGLSITPIDIKHWIHLDVARDYGKHILLLSIILMSLGLIIRFIYLERWLMVSLYEDEGDRKVLEVSGYSRHFPALFEGEVRRIADGLGVYGKTQ